MLKVKEFISYTNDIDKQINDFINDKKNQIDTIIDIKYCMSSTYEPSCNTIHRTGALLIYEEKEKEFVGTYSRYNGEITMRGGDLVAKH